MGDRLTATGPTVGRPLPPEFALAVACCRWPPSPERDRRVREAANGVDWALLLAVARRHRVEGLVHHALTGAGVSPPPGVAKELAADAGRIARQNLIFAGESVRLHARLVAAGVPVLFFKGVTLARLAYGSLALKMGRDIDLVVPPERLDSAASVLEEAGYAMTVPEPPADRATLAFWHEHWKEFGVARPAAGNRCRAAHPARGQSGDASRFRRALAAAGGRGGFRPVAADARAR